jgi:hypothetical protein
MKPKFLSVLIGLTLTLSAASSAAHHAFAGVFDRDASLDLTGTVTKIEWMNPHTWFYIDVQNEDGEIESWGFEMGSPNTLVRRGWSHDTLQVGQVVTVLGARARDGSMRGAVRTVTLANGERLFGGQNESR